MQIIFFSLPGIAGEEVQEVYMGNVLQAMEGQAPSRQATLRAGKCQFFFFAVIVSL